MTRTATRTPYEILGVSAFDDRATIRTAWKRLVRENHPDRCPADAARLTRRLADLNAAYDKLRHHVPATGRGAAGTNREADTRPEAKARPKSDAPRRTQAHAQAKAGSGAKKNASEQPKAKPTATRSRKETRAPSLSPAQRAALQKATASFSTARAAFETACKAQVAIAA